MEIFENEVGPFVVVAHASDLDMTTVTAATIVLTASNGARIVWAAALSEQTTSSAKLTYTLVAGSFPSLGRYHYYISLTAGAATPRRTTTNSFDVVGEFN